MTRKYDYSLPYTESDPNIKHRRCRFCKKMSNIKELETKSCCSVCYTIIYDRKRCNKCLLRKKINYFKKSKPYKDGYKSKCTDCDPTQAVNPEKQKERHQRWVDRKKGKIPPIMPKNTVHSRTYRKKSKERQEFIDSVLEEFKDYKENYWLSKLESQNKRRFLLRKSTIKGFRKEIKDIKDLSKQKGKEYRLDHIIPIINEKVCGLNVPWNLQILTKEENSYKSNRFDGTTDNNSWKKDLYTKKSKNNNL